MLAVVVALVVVLFPLYWMIVTAILPSQVVLSRRRRCFPICT